ncbi:pyridoxal 5'-phosphate synthase glutaminase subunit PdxT [Methanobacterium paludis]|uniref:Pyridoxal 5'-phosphate synthase subunit PdxT n=1 Tax=Methanobacterium paludis (strain DSM 25820 / JCM 18151 / SWAN1) TaxID=868131 RepID=F6D4D6_METPW|nr:pyridoxal 5'-phosphate synthase glutaminase subunit PdxT [Methanobacterium paludis]AEG18799.1 Glutamine amidotransferase subunit pdxT [Methanobacterium paludis]
MIKIGILDLQGDVSEHLEITEKTLKQKNVESQVLRVKTVSDVSKCDGIIISGGESTVISKLMEKTGIKRAIIDKKIPVMGTCAGMVLLATKTDYEQPLLGLIDMKVKRNGFGRQRASFEEEIEIFGSEYKGIFIRAPYVSEVGDNVEILAKRDDKIVAVAQGHNVATAFHPELTDDKRIHEYFIKEVLKCVE